MPTLETPRLVLREIAQADFAAIHSWAGNIGNVKYMAWGPNSEEQTRQFIENCANAARAEPRTSFDFILELKSGGRVIGTGGIYRKMDWHGRRFVRGDLGWILHRDYWKQGYCTEFAAELLRFGFEELCLHRIAASCDAENYGSYRVMERGGMLREAVRKEAILGRDSLWHDQYEYAILREEWEARKLP